MELVSGGAKCVKRAHDVVPCPQSGYGNIANDISNGLHEVGSAIGVFIYDLFH